MDKKSRNCFVSYHHYRDQKYINKLRGLVKEMKVADHSLKHNIGHLTEDSIYKKVRNKMRQCSVTIVLIGERTGHRKWIDWEIWASLRAHRHPYDTYRDFKPKGLLGIFLPTETHSIPSRLQDNIDSGFAVSMKWENLKQDFESKVNYAHWKRTNVAYKINNRRSRQQHNYTDIFGFRI